MADNLIEYSRLAGEYYTGLDDKYKIDKSNYLNAVYTYAVPAVHTSFIDTSQALGPPSTIRVRPNKTVTEADGTVVASSKVSVTYREQFHSFKYYESLGSIYGAHNIIMDRKDSSQGVYIRERWHGEPIFAERIDSINADNLSRLDDTEGNCLLSLYAKLDDSEDGIDLEFDSITKDPDGRRFLDIFVGEFHLLPDNPRSIYRTNISWDIHPVSNRIQHNKSGKSICLSDGDNIQSFLSSNGIDVLSSNPDNSAYKKQISPMNSDFIEYYIGLARVPAISSRPKNMGSKIISMRHPDYLEAGAQIRWRSLKDRCSSWIRIYDGTDISKVISEDVFRNGHYVVNTKIRIDIDKFKAYLEHLNSGIDEKIDWKLLLWLPWYSVLGHNSVDTVIYPKLSSFIDAFDQLEFKVPDNYKSNGAFHFTIKVWNSDKSNLIYYDSSDASEEFYFDKEIFPDGIKKGKWYISNQSNNETYVEISSGRIKFNSDYEVGHGVNHEDYGTIRYIPSNDLSAYIVQNPGIYVQIVTHDGTLNNNPGLTIK